MFSCLCFTLIADNSSAHHVSTGKLGGSHILTGQVVSCQPVSNVEARSPDIELAKHDVLKQRESLYMENARVNVKVHHTDGSAIAAHLTRISVCYPACLSIS